MLVFNKYPFVISWTQVVVEPVTTTYGNTACAKRLTVFLGGMGP